MDWLTSQFSNFPFPTLPSFSTKRNQEGDSDRGSIDSEGSKRTSSTASLSDRESEEAVSSDGGQADSLPLSVEKTHSWKSWFSFSTPWKSSSSQSSFSELPQFQGEEKDAHELLKNLTDTFQDSPRKLVLKPHPTEANKMVLEPQKQTWRSWFSFSPSLKEREKTAHYIKSVFEKAYDPQFLHLQGAGGSIDDYLTPDQIHREGVEALQKAYRFAEVRKAIHNQFPELPLDFCSKPLQQQLSQRKNVHDFKASEHFRPIAKGLLKLLEGEKQYPLENIFYDKESRRVIVPEVAPLQNAKSTTTNNPTALDFQNAAILLTELAAGEYAAKEIKAYLEDKSPNKLSLKNAAKEEPLSEKELARMRAKEKIMQQEESEGKFIHVKPPKDRLEFILQGIPTERAEMITLFVKASEAKEPEEKEKFIQKLKALLPDKKNP